MRLQISKVFGINQFCRRYSQGTRFGALNRGPDDACVAAADDDDDAAAAADDDGAAGEDVDGADAAGGVSAVACGVPADEEGDAAA